MRDVEVLLERIRDKDDFVNPLKFDENSEKYFQELLKCKEEKEEFYLPITNFKPKRHKKVYWTAKPLRWWICFLEVYNFFKTIFDTVDIILDLNKKMKQDQLYFYDYKFECEIQKFCNSLISEGHSEELKFFEARCPPRSIYIMKEEWFCCLSRENRTICNYCDSPD